MDIPYDPQYPGTNFTPPKDLTCSTMLFCGGPRPGQAREEPAQDNLHHQRWPRVRSNASYSDVLKVLLSNGSAGIRHRLRQCGDSCLQQAGKIAFAGVGLQRHSAQIRERDRRRDSQRTQSKTCIESAYQRAHRAMPATSTRWATRRAPLPAALIGEIEVRVARPGLQELRSRPCVLVYAKAAIIRCQ